MRSFVPKFPLSHFADALLIPDTSPHLTSTAPPQTIPSTPSSQSCSDKTRDSCCDKMFEGFTFDQKEDSAVPPHDVEADISPSDIDVPAAKCQWPNPAAPPATLAFAPNLHLHLGQQYCSESIDSLVLQMSEQSLRTNTQSASHHQTWILDDEPDIPQTSRLAQSIQEPSPSEPHNPTLYSVPAAPNDHLRSQPPPSTHALGTTTKEEEAAPPVVPDSRQPERQMDARATNNTFNPRAVRESLMELMITGGMQCNVQSSMPLSPLAVSRPTYSSVSPLCVFDDDEPMDDVGMSLEVDEGYNEQEDENLFNSLVSLRQAGTPGGIRRICGLRYRRSAELAMQSKNLRHNTLKMRKRSKPRSPIQTQPSPDPSVETSCN